MIVHHAAWVLPIAAPPIRNGWVAVHRGRITAVGGPADEPPGHSGRQSASLNAPGAPPPGALRSLRSRAPFGPAGSLRDPAFAILPAVVNAHTHLELSWMRGRVPPAPTMPGWAARLIALRRETPPDHEMTIAKAIREMRECGTALVGDTTNTLASYHYLAESGLSGCVFYELLGFNAADPAGVVTEAARRLAELTPLAWLRPSIVPHAPYSVSADLLTDIAAASPSRGSDPRTVMSIHVGESAEEVRFLQRGDGPWRDLLTDIGAWTPHWTPPGCGAIEYLDRLGFVSDRLLAVHCVQLQDAELARLAGARATVVTCPRSNNWTGAGMPPIERFYASGVRVAIGTDSLASAEDLNVFSELRAARSAAPGVPASRLLESATRSGARALGFGDEFGTIESGKRAELIAVALPAGVEDVEEYLLSGIPPNAIRWLDPD